MIKNWAAWAPSLSTPADFAAWADGTAAWGTEGVADVSFLPAKFRRRLTPLAKMGLAVAHGCLSPTTYDPAKMRTVFASRYGEHNLTVQILREIIQDEGVSPMRFAMSVHNSTSGLFSSGSENTEPTTALSGGPDTFFYALLEAAAQLHRDPSAPVLVVMCEEPLDPIYHHFVDEQQIPYAVAMLLGADEVGFPVQVDLSPTAPLPEQLLSDPREMMPRAMALLQWLLQDSSTSWQSTSGVRTWNWTKSGAIQSCQYPNPMAV